MIRIEGVEVEFERVTDWVTDCSSDRTVEFICEWPLTVEQAARVVEQIARVFRWERITTFSWDGNKTITAVFGDRG